MKLLKDESLVSQWQKFFEDHCKSDIETVALEYPEKRSLYVDYWKIDEADPKLAELLLDQPYKAIYNAEQALRKIDVAAENTLQLHFRVINLPDTNRILIRKIRSNHLGKLMAVDGLVKKRTEVRPKLQVGAFQCQKCGAIIRVEQDEDILKEPTECYEDQGGCGRVSSFKLLPSLSQFADSQKIEIQENPEGLRGGAQPERISVFLEDDLAGEIAPGDRVVVNGILHSMQRRRGTYRLTAFDKTMEAISVESQELAFEEVEITPEDEKEILKISKDPELYKKMKESIAPTIYGMDVEKEALVLQLFGGLAKEMPDGTRIRGDIHALLVGDPGTAKSQILTYMSKLAPRSVYASGKASSAAGLTAAAVRDEFGEGQWTLEAGALVLADMGIACIDEIDKMDETDRSALHQAMEQQEISVAKAGINATLKSRCALLAAANPKFGRFDPYEVIAKQIDLPPTLINRFDLIFAIRDIPDKDKDSKMASFILHLHKDPTGDVPEIETRLIRKYIAYAKQNIAPELTDAAIEEIKAYYLKMRFKGMTEGEVKSVPISARQLEALVRLAEAQAKLRLSKKVTRKDAKEAVSLLHYSLSQIGVDPETGEIDIDRITTGITSSERSKIVNVREIINELENKLGRTIPIDEIIQMASEKGMSEEKVEEAIEKLKKSGDIFEPRRGFISKI